VPKAQRGVGRAADLLQANQGHTFDCIITYSDELLLCRRRSGGKSYLDDQKLLPLKRLVNVHILGLVVFEQFSLFKKQANFSFAAFLTV